MVYAAGFWTFREGRTGYRADRPERAGGFGGVGGRPLIGRDPFSGLCEVQRNSTRRGRFRQGDALILGFEK
jgi:hypothetical protein